jgi:hypothetical protein
MVQENPPCVASPIQHPDSALSSTMFRHVSTIGVLSPDIMVEANSYIERRAANSLISLVTHLVVSGAPLILPFFSTTPHLAPGASDTVTIPLPPLKKALKVETLPGNFDEECTLFRAACDPPLFSPRRISVNPPDPLPPLDGFRSESLASTLRSGDVLGGILSDSQAPLVSPVMPESRHAEHPGEK